MKAQKQHARKQNATRGEGAGDEGRGPADIDGLRGDWRQWQPRVKDRALSLLSWGTSATWLTGWTSVLTPLNYAIGGWTLPVQRLSQFFSRGMVASTFSRWNAWVHPEVRDDEQYIFVQNHVNHFDFITMYPATPHYKQGLELETHFKYPVYGWFMRSRGTVTVPARREERLPVVRESIRGELAAGRSILAFPEGTRTRNGRVGTFRKGVFVIARALGAKVVPTTVVGMYEVMRKGSLFIRPGGDVKVYCDAPVSFAGVQEHELDAKIAEVRDPIVRRVDAHYEQNGEGQCR